MTTLVSGGDAQNLNFAIPVEWLKELPERHATLHPAAAAPASGLAAAKDPPPWVPAIDDVSRLPHSSPRMVERCREFLSKPPPRAFAVGESSGWWSSWGTPPKGEPTDPAERALRKCEALTKARCLLYAVDERVVYSFPDVAP